MSQKQTRLLFSKKIKFKCQLEEVELREQGREWRGKEKRTDMGHTEHHRLRLEIAILL